MKNKLKVLFLCTGNSCRSQMAEGWTRNLHNDYIQVYSAGIETHGLNPNAIKVMAEVGIDITSHKSQHISEFDEITFDYVITVCDNAHESCPNFYSSTKIIHESFDDPPRLVKDSQSKEDKLKHYRRVRDEIKAYILKLPEYLANK